MIDWIMFFETYDIIVALKWIALTSICLFVGCGIGIGCMVSLFLEERKERIRLEEEMKDMWTMQSGHPAYDTDSMRMKSGRNTV